MIILKHSASHASTVILQYVNASVQSVLLKLVLNSTPGINSTSELPAALRASGIPSRVSWSVRAMALRFLEEAIAISSEGVLVPSEYVSVRANLPVSYYNLISAHDF